MKPRIPTFKTDKEAEDFVDSADLTDYDLSGAKRVHFEFSPKDKSINLRLPTKLFEAVQAAAQHEGVPYQRYIRLMLEQALHAKSKNTPR